MNSKDKKERSKSKSPEAEQHSKAQEFKNAGNDKFNKNNYRGAVSDYKKGLLHEPNNSDLHCNLSAAYIHLEKYIEAEEHALYAIHLKPSFYKGYSRAAKAAHGKGMTRLALKRLESGLEAVTEETGVKELQRLKKQYTSYLSLPMNAERELNFDSDTYHSEDESDIPISDDEGSDSDNFPPPPDPDVKPAKVNSKPQEETTKKVIKTEKPPEPPKEELDPSLSTSGKNVLEPPDPKCKPQPVSSAKDLETSSAVGTVTQDPSSSTEDGRKIKEEGKKDEVKAKEKSVERDMTSDKDKNSKLGPEDDKFLQMCKELSNPNLKQHVVEFKDNLKMGSEAFLNENYKRAAECYKAAKERVGMPLSDYEIDDRQLHVIKYAYCTSLINLNTYIDIVKAIQELTSMEGYHLSIPALYIQLARAYCKLNRFKTAVEPLEKLQEILDNFQIFPTFTWPGTNQTIQETTPTGLKDALKELNQMSRMSHKPTAVCRFDNCLKISTHILPSELIYVSDPDFVGYISLICEEKCRIDFHTACWKSYKESISGGGKVTDKDILGRHCLTTDCINSEGQSSVITVIEIFDADGEIKSVNKFDNKESVDAKKARKRKVRLDDKEKVSKSKKNVTEKKMRETKKPVAVAEECEESASLADPEKALQSRKESLTELRKASFGLEISRDWNPMLPYYGREDESAKAGAGLFLDVFTGQNETAEVKNAKEYLFSYFTSILKEEGPLQQSEIEELWKDSAGTIFDIKIVLPDLKSMCDLLLESTRFCQLEDYICLSDQLDEAYKLIKIGVSETVTFLMTGSVKAAAAGTLVLPPGELAESVQTHLTSNLPDLLSHPLVGNTQFEFQNVASEDEYSESSDEDSEEEGSENEEDKEDEDNYDLRQKFNAFQAESSSQARLSPPKPLDDGRISLQEMLNEMTRLKSSILGSEEVERDQKELEPNRDEFEPQNETFETARESSVESPSSSSDGLTSVSLKIEVNEEVSSSDEQLNSIENEDGYGIMSKTNPAKHTGCGDGESEGPKSNGSDKDGNHSDSSIETVQTLELDKASQSAVATEERHIQTIPMETKDNLSQTKDSDLFKDLNRKLGELSAKLATCETVNSKLRQELAAKDAFAKELKTAHDISLNKLQEETAKRIEIQKTYHDKLIESKRKEVIEAQKCGELQSRMASMKEVCDAALLEKTQLKFEISKMTKEMADLNQNYTVSINNVRENENRFKAMESVMKTKLIKTLQSQLLTIRAHWESQINMLKKQCVEKISEMQNWFSNFSSEEVEGLPSWNAIYLNIKQWNEVSKAIQNIEGEFLKKCLEMENRIAVGEVDDLSSFVLPSLPEEPCPLPLDKITKEITEKHVIKNNELMKKVTDLTHLVVNQQLEIEKSKKEANQQVQHLMNSFQMVQPRMQSPMTTAFGGLALQYPYPPGAATANSLFGTQPSAVVPTIPPPIGQEASKTAPTPKPLHTDVQTLLQESSKAISFGSLGIGNPFTKDDNGAVSGLGSSSLLNKFPFSSPPPPLNNSISNVPTPILSFPPPPMGVAQNVLKASIGSNVKEEKKQPERSVTPKQIPEVKSVRSRETTPVPTPAPSVAPPSAEKTKKKKKKGDSRDTSEARITIGTSGSESASLLEKASSMTVVNKEEEWSVVGMPKIKQPAAPVLQMPDSKLKNKKKLLDKLAVRFPTVQMKDLDEIVKLVREQNNGSLSGLPFDEIEARVERFVTKRHFQKTSTMGLVKFTASAWGTMKQPEKENKADIHLDECVFCLEPMENDRTRIDCNHEFHTQCLRTWFKEKRICPLCQKFAAMPDEFPAL